MSKAVKSPPKCPKCDPKYAEALEPYDPELRVGRCKVHGTQFLSDTTLRVKGGAERDAQVAVA